MWQGIVYPLYFLEKMLFRLDSTWSWFIPASIMAVILSIKYRPSIIYSTGGPVSAHIGGVVPSRITGSPHIAEFLDMLSLLDSKGTSLKSLRQKY